MLPICLEGCRSDVRGAEGQLSHLHSPRPSHPPPPGQRLSSASPQWRQPVLWNSSILQAGLTGWTLASAMRNELSSSRQEIQASMVLPRLPAPAQPPGRLWLLQLAVVGRAARPPEIPAQLRRVGVARASFRAPTQRGWPLGQGHRRSSGCSAFIC